MKFSIVLICCCALFVVPGSSGQKIVLPKEIVELLDNLSKLCQSETGISAEAMEDVRRAKLSEDRPVKCYLKCMMRQLQTMNEKGELDMEIIEATMPEELKNHGGLDTVKKCKDIKEADMCDTAYKVMKCIQDTDPTLTAMFD